MAKCDGIEPSTLVMDVEGTDGGERGEDDTAFEKRSTLFALYVSDILLINMWYNDIGREQAANKPLLRIVFQVVMRLFTDFSSRKRTLIFVIRDMIMVTPLEILKSQLMNDMQKIWDSVPKSEDSKNTPLSEFFNVEVVALSHYVLMKEQFKKEVTSLRQRFFHSIESGGLAGDRQDVLSASGFSLNVEMIWEKIKENKDLNLPAHKLMVATVRCEQIADETFSCFVADKDWCNLKKAVQSRPILRFGKKLSLLLDTYLSEYDAEALYFDEEIRSKKREVLKRNLLQHVQASYHSMLTHIRSRSLCKFKEIFAKTLDGGEGFYMAARGCTKSSMSLFDEGCADAVIKLANWDISESRNKLLHDIDAHVASVCAAKLSELTALYEAKLNEAISEPFKDLLDRAGNDTWQEIRKLLQRESESAVSRLSGELSGFEMDKQTSSTLLVNLKDYARRAVEAKAREEAGRVQIHMKDRFVKSFGFDSDSVQRVWTGMEDIRAIATYARLSPLKLLSVMAAIRLDGDVDNIENTLSLALLDSTNHAVPSSRITSVDPMASRTWEEVLPSNTLITPIRCKSLWRNFLAETEHIVSRAIAAQRKVATARCKRIANKNFSCFAEDEIWRGVENNVKSGPIPSFGKTLSSLFDTYLSKYDVEAAYFIEDVRSAKHKELEEKLHQHVRPAYKSMLGHIRSRVLDEFKVKFEEILKGTDDISVAIEDCVQSSVNRFKQECEDAGIELTHCDAIEAKHKLKDGVSAHVINGLTKHRATFAAANNNGRNDEASSGYWVDGITSFLQLLNTIVTIIATIFGGA